MNKTFNQTKKLTKMAENKNTVVVYADWKSQFENLSDEEAGRLIKHFFRYINDENPLPPDRLTQIAFEPIKQSLKRDLKKWEAKTDERSFSGKKGNLKKWYPQIYAEYENGNLTLEEALEIAERYKSSLSDNKSNNKNTNNSSLSDTFDSLSDIKPSLSDNSDNNHSLSDKNGHSATTAIATIANIADSVTVTDKKEKTQKENPSVSEFLAFAKKHKLWHDENLLKEKFEEWDSANWMVGDLKIVNWQISLRMFCRDLKEKNRFDLILEGQSIPPAKPPITVSPPFNFLQGLLDAGADPELAKEWMGIRRKKRAIDSDRSLKVFLKEVSLSGKTINQILLICCNEGWKGFHANWEYNGKQEITKQPTPEEQKRKETFKKNSDEWEQLTRQAEENQRKERENKFQDEVDS